MTRQQDARVSRRTLLKGAGAAGALGAVGAVGAVAAVRSEDRGAGVAAGSEGGRFDLSSASHAFGPVQRTVLHETFQVLQSFTFDNVNRRLFVAQVQGGEDGNDLCISQLDRHGTLVGYMHVPDVGHGVSIAVEPVGTTSYLWTEAESSQPAEKGRGTALQRFAFRSGETPQDAKVYLRGSDNITCATDVDSQRLLVRRHSGGEDEFQVYDLAAARDDDFSRPLTPAVRPETDGSFQGYTFFGDHLYILNGGFSETPADINSTLSCFDLTTGDLVQGPVPELIRPDLPFREPEGMAVFRTSKGTPQLCWGYASTQEEVRFVNIFYKDVLLS